jgi:hypothetical protein
MTANTVSSWQEFFRKRRLGAIGIVLLTASCVGLYFWVAARNNPHWTTLPPQPYYGWQIEAWLQGHLYLPIKPHPALLTLPNPYDGAANAPYRVLDLSFYHGRYYSYFGVAPVVLLFLPWKLLSGTYPTFAFAAALFSSCAFLANAAVLLALWRRFLPATPTGAVVLALGVLAVGGLQLNLLIAPAVYEVAQTCALAGLAGCLACVYAALVAERRTGLWLAMASSAAAVTIASRPNYLPVVAALGVAWWTKVEWKSPGWLRSVMWRTAAASLPLMLGVGGMLLHNYLRFDNPLEFGARYQLSPTDYTHTVYFSASRIIPHLRKYLVDDGRITMGGYFPFVRLAGPVVPIGFLKWLPYTWGVLGLIWLSARPGTPGKLRQWSLAWLLTDLGLTLLLTSYFLAWLRYEIDLTAPLMLGAAVGWLAFAAQSGRIGRCLALAGGALGLTTLCLGLLIGMRQLGDQPALAPLARVADFPRHLWERLHGMQFGPLHLQVEFARNRFGRKEPLVATGLDSGDLVYVHYVDEGHVSLGYFHSGFGGPETLPLAIDYALPHDVDIFMGSFVPPSTETTRAGWTPDELARLHRTLFLKLDGRTVMQRSVSFFDSTPDSLRVAWNPRVPKIIEPTFTGRILERAQGILSRDLLAPPPSWPDAIEMQVRFWPGRTGRIEPLITTGVAGAGEALSVAYLPDDRICFELDHWGDRLHVGPPMAVDFSKPHVLLVRLPTLFGTPAPRKDDFCAVVLDGQPAFIVRDIAAYYPSARDKVVFGFNAIGAGTTDTMFSGGIDDIVPEPRGAMARALTSAPGRAGRLIMLVDFPGPEVATGQPLIVTGVNGAGDLIFVQRVDSWRVRFGLDHWGGGARYGEPVEIRPGYTYRLEIAMDSLWPRDEPRPAPERGHVRVTLDGREVLSLESSCHPAAPDQVFIGRNPIGGTSCRPQFEGDILYVRRLP